MTGDFCSSHASATLAAGTFRPAAIFSSGPPGCARLPVASGNQGMKPIFSRVAIRQHIFRSAIDEVVAILHRHYGRQFPHGFNLLDADFRQTDVMNFPCLPQIKQRADLIGHRHLAIDAMQLIEWNAIELQPLQASFARFAKMCWAAILNPFARAWPLKAPLGRDDQSRRVGMQRLGDQSLGNFRAI